MGAHSCCGGKVVHKGLWLPEEDEMLINYMNTYRHTSWTVVPRLAGLQRCAKSCRLRWTNYLRPNLKRGAFTEKEARSVNQLHAIYGNKWALIAKHLPGRTDNEVKNFYNSNIKNRRLDQHRRQSRDPKSQRRKVTADRLRQQQQVLLPVAHDVPHLQRHNVNMMMMNNATNIYRHHRRREGIIQNPQQADNNQVTVPMAGPVINNDATPNGPMNGMIMPSTTRHRFNPLASSFKPSPIVMIPSPPHAPLQGLFVTSEANPQVPNKTGIAIDDQEQFLEALTQEIEMGFESAYKNKNPATELANPWAIINNEIAMQDSNNGGMIFCDDPAVSETEKNDWEDFLLDDPIPELDVVPAADPPVIAEDPPRETTQGDACGFSYANHVNNIKSLMGSFANRGVNSAATVDMAQAAQVFDPMQTGGADDKGPYFFTNKFGSIWDPKQP